MKTSPDPSPAAADGRLNSAVAITVALLSAFMGLCDLKADGLLRAMQRARADQSNHWAFYQARNLREEVARTAQVQLKLQAAGRSPNERRPYDDAIAEYDALIAQQAEKKEALRLQAEADQRAHEALSARHERFESADAPFTMAIALLAMTSLTRRRWLFVVALVPALWGLAMAGWGWLG